MSSLRFNSLANFAGQLIGTVVSFIVVPFYMRFLGAEAYGLIGFFLTLQSTLAILDLGLSVTANREVSRFIAQKVEIAVLRRFLRTLEIFYWLIGISVVMILGLASGWLAKDWIQANVLTTEQVRTCVFLSVTTIGIRWPTSLYQGVLRGLERQISLNLVQAAIAVLRGGGGVALLWLVSPSVVLFHQWQLLMGIAEVLCMLVLAWNSLGGLPLLGVGWDMAVFKGVWRFAIKIAGASVFAMLLKQVDRILISKMLSLEQLGYYTTAVIAGMGLAKIFVPVQAAIFPRLTKQHSVGDQEGLSNTFHGGCQAVAFLVAAPAAIMVFFSHEILMVWTLSEECVKYASAPLAITALAMLFNSMMSIPFSLAVGTGMPWLPMWTNGIGVVLLTPLTFFLVKHYGIAGGAWAWLAFNLGYYLIVPHVLFRNALQQEKWRWYVQDTGFFIVVALSVFFVARQLSAGFLSMLSKWGCIGVAGLAYGAICLFFSSGVRSLFLKISFLRQS